MIGYKATDKYGCCRGFKFEVGKTYTKDIPKEELKCCTDKVFHFCRELSAIEKESNYKTSTVLREGEVKVKILNLTEIVWLF